MVRKPPADLGNHQHNCHLQNQTTSASIWKLAPLGSHYCPEKATIYRLPLWHHACYNPPHQTGPHICLSTSVSRQWAICWLCPRKARHLHNGTWVEKWRRVAYLTSSFQILSVCTSINSHSTLGLWHHGGKGMMLCWARGKVRM